ncbi:hypothetical protein SELMODRAFT_407822 [Selaginella moellendorffii]|uniref:Uncharacterized protein n=1 Tax=Selaginella moellendorffii TaxID=88036 RepID=D8R4V5_SELML|nr:hypothetical protein SELMODRAFT_407822 [Selaginella moellendorffii]
MPTVSKELRCASTSLPMMGKKEGYLMHAWASDEKWQLGNTQVFRSKTPPPEHHVVKELFISILAANLLSTCHAVERSLEEMLPNGQDIKLVGGRVFNVYPGDEYLHILPEDKENKGIFLRKDCFHDEAAQHAVEMEYIVVELTDQKENLEKTTSTPCRAEGLGCSIHWQIRCNGLWNGFHDPLNQTTKPYIGKGGIYVASWTTVSCIAQGQPRTRPWKKIIVVIEDIYSIEGEICRLKEIVQVCKAYKCTLMRHTHWKDWESARLILVTYTKSLVLPRDTLGKDISEVGDDKGILAKHPPIVIFAIIHRPCFANFIFYSLSWDASSGAAVPVSSFLKRSSAWSVAFESLGELAIKLLRKVHGHPTREFTGENAKVSGKRNDFTASCFMACVNALLYLGNERNKEHEGRTEMEVESSYL